MRDTFIKKLCEIAEKKPNIALLIGDIGFSVVEQFRESFPDRFFNVGVAEQNMASIAAGMASEGYHVFTYSIANFPVFRCAEQIRNDIDYHKLSVTTVAVGGGLSYGALGYSHHAVQDYAFFRSLPNMVIAAPGDPIEVQACLEYLVNNPCPSYLRLGKSGEPNLNHGSITIQPGEWNLVSGEYGSNDKAILTTGAALQTACLKYRANTEEQIPVYSMPIWGMGFKEKQALWVNKFKKVTTYENHLMDGGFASWLLESLISKPELLARIAPVALNADAINRVGDQDYLHKIGGLF
jgi:transketolase